VAVVDFQLLVPEAQAVAALVRHLVFPHLEQQTRAAVEVALLQRVAMVVLAAQVSSLFG
jgi:hypothetical protein